MHDLRSYSLVLLSSVGSERQVSYVGFDFDERALLLPSNYIIAERFSTTYTSELLIVIAPTAIAWSLPSA
jgi:hypothetical protein